MKLITTSQKREGDFLIKAFFNSDSERPSRIDVERKVRFTFNDTLVEEEAILRFKDNHKGGEIYTSKIIFAGLTVDEASHISGLGIFPRDPFPPSEYRLNPTLKTIWENPTEDRHIREFMKLFNNFHLFIKDGFAFSGESSLQNFARSIYKVYKEKRENAKVGVISYIPQTNHIESFDLLNKVFGDSGRS